MSQTETQTTQTIHGGIEYETATCDSCEQDVLPDEVVPFLILNDVKTNERRNTEHTHKDDYKRWEAYDGDYREGVVCENCRDDPLGWPEPSMIPASVHRLWWMFVGTLAYWGLGELGVLL